MTDRVLRTNNKKKKGHCHFSASLEQVPVDTPPIPTVEPTVDTPLTQTIRPVECSTDYALHRTQILDPLSVIINLAILSYKPVNTKISITNNCISVQETGIFQAFVRYLFRDNKYFLNLLYNPIELACEYFLDETRLDQFPKMKPLFERALVGINQLSQTYADDNVIRLCLNYYSSLIQNFLGKHYDDNLFKLDAMTPHYKKDLIEKMNERWTVEKIKVITEMNDFLMTGTGTNSTADNATTTMAKYDNVMCMQMFMRDIDAETARIIYTV